jgi:dolichyldiphosphatase
MMKAMIPLDFTYVAYDPSDLMSMVFAIISLTPQVILVVYATLICSRREAESIMMLGGQFACELVNIYLKRIIKQERPKLYGNGYGMPSAHSQFMAYYVTYICLWMLFRVRHFSTRKKLSRALFLFVLGGLVCYSRVYSDFHSGLQVAAGILVGIALGAVWFISIVLLRDLGIIDLLLDTWPARWFYVKDTAGEKASFVRDEYSEWRRMRMKMKLLIKAE